jgi:uncharacterized protein YfaS (alpha-2-macroglobulin family)
MIARKTGFRGLFLMTVLIAALTAAACNPGVSELPGPDPRILSALSGGVLSRNSEIELVFTEEQNTSKPLRASFLQIKPAIKGSLSWKNNYTLVFSPASLLPAARRYEVKVEDKERGIPAFTFAFETSPAMVEVNLDPVAVTEEGNALVSGSLSVDEGEETSRVERVISSPDLGKPRWTHENGTHRFAFEPVKREAAIRNVSVAWDGGVLGSKEKGMLPVRIPGSGSFEPVDYRIREQGVLEITFSAPLKPNKDLRGFVSLSGNTNIRYSIEGNLVKIFGIQGADGVRPGAELLIQDLADIDGNVLARPVQYRVPDTWELPEIRFAGTGTILPTSQGSSMVIETRNVSGVLVEAFRIYGDNMIQFLQVNNLGGTRELGRVGEPVWTAGFDFPWNAADKNRWVRRGLDLSALAQKYPESAFHIRVSFRIRHIRYEASGNSDDFSGLQFPDDSFQELPAFDSENSNWDYYDRYDNYDFYRQRKNPRHPAFYAAYGDHNITIGRNVMISDLGLLAKKGLDGTWIFAASNLKTARPLPEAEIEILNFQGRRLALTKTGADGFALIPASQTLQGIPAFLRARGSPGSSFLKINDSLALPVSHFDVSGGSPLSGQRGLIYGDRGVWRPGDDIYLTFLLSDPGGTLPADHPVSFELEDPRGRILEQKIFNSSVDGFYAIPVSTKPDAPTGDWTARIKVGGHTYQKTLKIETVMPNRLKMNLDFDGASVLEGGKKNVSLEAAWLYGAPAPGLKADVSVSFSDTETVFPSYTDYSFRDLSRTVSSERQMIYEGNLDDAGKTSFTMELNPGSAVPGKLAARFFTRVFEPSGVFSSEQVGMEFSPYKRYVGLKLPRGDESRNMLLTDTDHRADIVVLDGSGRYVTENLELDCAVYKISWRWWWEKGEGERAEFTSALSRNPVARETINTANGKASWNFQVKYPDWGRYMVVIRDRAGGHSSSSIVYIDWPGWAGRAQEEGQGSWAMLMLSSEKPEYRAGEKARLSFPSNKDAAALVTLEKGGCILREEWINCTGDITAYEFTADPSMIPNVYVHVTLLQPHLQTKNDLPMRLYGVVPVMIDDPGTRINPVIEAPVNWQPESSASFTVSEASGRPMVYTAAVVDEGLLGLTRYTLPNPWNTFYAKEASFIKSWDLYQEIMGAWAGQLETLLAIGGGDDIFDDSAKETRRFKPVVRYFGPFELKAGEKRTETFNLPPYAGALRIMVMAASSTKEAPAAYRSGRAYGRAEKPVTVSSDLMVFGTIPRLLSPGDEALIPVSVNSYKEGARSVTVTLKADGALLPGGGTETLDFEKPGEQMINFTLKAPPGPGKIKLSISAESAGLKTANHVTDLEVRSTAAPVSKSVVSLVEPGSTWEGEIAFPGQPGTNRGLIEFSRLPSLNLESRLAYLVSYPHGCIEQTTSAVFPQLYLDKILSLDGDRQAEIRANIAAGIERLSAFQVPGGGFSYWPGGGQANDWGTTYGGHFLLEARRAGYTVPGNLISQWARYQKERAGLWQNNDSNQTEQAYRLYTLALAGEADLGSMNRLREQRNLTPRAAWKLAAAYWYAGQRDTARNMVRDLDTQVAEYRELSGTFGSALRDKAMILETMNLLEDTARSKIIFEELAAALSSEKWLSTQETAYSLIAMIPYLRGSAGTGPLNVEAVLAGSSKKAAFASPVYQLDMGSLSGDSGTYRITNPSGAPVYARVILRGIPAEGSEPAMSEGLDLRVEYRDPDGVSLDPELIKTGGDIEIRVTVKNNTYQKVSEIALVHPIPASWEIINYRLGGEDSSASRYKYQDIRDDRIMTYFDLERGASLILTFGVNKTYGGNYFRPAVHAYAMYDESIRALVPGVKPAEN